MLTALQSMTAVHDDIAPLNLDWARAMVIVRNVAGANVTAGLTVDTNFMVPFFHALSSGRLPADRVFIAPYARVMPDVGADTFLVDVIRGDACVDAPLGGAVGITSYDWCVDGKSADGMIGESPCSIDGPIHCNDNSAKYFIRVYRKPGAPAACAGYKIAVSAKGGDACDFTQQCN